MLSTEPTPGRYQNEIRVVVKRPGATAGIVYIKNELRNLQEYVGGYIEVVPFGALRLIVNEEGKLRGLAPNVRTAYGVIYGNLIVAAFDRGGNFKSLDREQADMVVDILNEHAVENEPVIAP